MDSPLNEMISRSQNRVAAVSKVKGSILSLRQQVIKLVEESNASLLEERRVTPRSALIVMDRASAELSSLSKASREYGVLREVNKFISLSSYGITAGGSVKHSDLLPQGHPFSSLNVFASDSVILAKNAEWLSADPKIDDSVRSLVATAFSLPVDSLERKHAFARLSVVKASLVPLHLKSDFILEALVASFGDGNSSASRRARVALQWRDRLGRWVEMGRGVNFSVRLKDGSIHVVNGVYVGAGGDTRVWMGGRRVGEMSTDTGLVQVSGDFDLPDGLYKVGSRNAETYKARIPGEELRKLKLWDQSNESFVDEFSQDIPNIDDMLDTRREAPLGWSKNSDGSFSSDDNYGVVRNSDGSLTAYRLDSNGNRTDTPVGSGSNWSQINDILTKDEPSFDKEIEQSNSGELPLKGINPALDRFNPDVRARIESKYLIEQARKLAVEYHLPENVRIDQGLDQARRGVDSQGNAVPSEWVAQAGERSGVTGWVRFIGSDSNKYPIIAHEAGDGKFIFGNRSTWNAGSDGSPKQYDSWQAIEKDIPSFVEYLNSSFTKNNPIDFTPITDFGKQSEVDAAKSDPTLEPVVLNGKVVDNAYNYGAGGRIVWNDVNDKWMVRNGAREINYGSTPSLEEAKRLIDGGAIPPSGPGEPPSDYNVGFEALRDEETLVEAGLDPDGEYEDSEILDAWLKAKGLDGRVKVKSLTEGYGGPESVLEIPEEAKADFVKGYGNFEPGVTFDDLVKDGMIERAAGQGGSGEEGGDGPGEPPTPPSSGGSSSGDSNSIGKDSTDQLFDSVNRAESGEEYVLLSDELLNADFVDEDSQKISSDFNKDEAVDGAVEMFKQKYSELLNQAIEYIYDESTQELDPPYVAAESTTPSQEFGASTVEQLFDSADREESGEIYILITEEIIGQGFGDAEEQMPSEFDRNQVIDAAVEVFKAKYIKLLDKAIANVTDDGGDDDGPGEPPTPPSGGTPPKTPSPSSPEAPALFNNFDAPTTAFQLRTAEYEQDGRVDETSTDFTDDPKRLATKFTPQDLVAAFSEALIGNSSDSAISEILNANVDDSGDIPSAEDLGNNVDIPQVSIGTPSGAGRLEFNAGEEYVPAGALYNAIWEAGMDPNRVIANIYDSVNGNNNNLDRLIEAQGGVPSPEEAKLVDDITAEIRQIIDATPIGDTSVSVSRDNKAYNLDDKHPGSLIENVPVDFNNPDYYIIDSNHYVPSQLELDADGYTDNPEYLAHMFNEADLIEQVLISVTDGSGAAYLAFNDLNTYEVPVEAVRDALQYLGVNTNNIIDMLNKESNDMSDDEPPVSTDSPATEQRQEPESASVPRNEIRWDAEKGLYTDSEGKVLDGDTVDAAGLDSSLRFGREADIPLLNPESTPDTPIVQPEPEVAETPATPTLTYPGPEIPGYSPNNTVISLDGRVMGAGTRVRANSDGKVGTVVSVQNIDSRTGQRIPYVRIRFDDGKVAVRSAVKVRVTDNAAPVVPAMPAPAATPRFIPDVTQRVNADIVNPAPVAGEGNIPGVASLGEIPQDVLPYVNADAVQKDFQAWGARASEIARAGSDRATLDNVKKAILDQLAAKKAYEAGRNNDNLSPEQLQDLADNDKKAKELVDTLVADAFGVRDGVSFGKGYTLKKAGVSTFIDGTPEEIENGTAKIRIATSMDINDKNGVKAGIVQRTITGQKVYNLDGTSSFEWQVKNSYMRMDGANKKSGFAFSYNRYMEDWYIANGVKEIHVMAAGGAGFEGAFVWALNGFNWDSSEIARSSDLLGKIRRMRGMESNPQVLAHLDNLASRVKEAERPDGTLDANKIPTPMEFALVGWYPGAKSWVGKKYMTNNSWNGVKRLDPAAVEQVQAVNYDQMRRARDRVENKENRANVSRELVMKMNSNDFFDNNEALRPYLAEIRDVFQNNRSLAALSPAAKNALNNYTAKQLLDSSRVMPFQDVIKLRNVLREEYRADNPSLGSNDFGVGNVLSEASPEDIANNTVSGFTIRELGLEESGWNDTYEAVHDASGQIFYVKNDKLAGSYRIDAVAAEVSAGALVNGLGIIGAYETRQNSNNSDIVVMQRAGSVVPLAGNPMTASAVFDYLNDLVAPDGSAVSVNSDTFIDKLSSPEDAARLILLDLLLSNGDRHNGNVLLALDGTDPSKIRILPIDHAFSRLSSDNAEIIDIEGILLEHEGNTYAMTMPALTRRLKADELLAMFRNEADSLRESLMKEEKFPTGPELDRIIQKWGSVNAFRDAINNRLDSMLKVNGDYHEEFLSMLNNRFWR